MIRNEDQIDNLRQIPFGEHSRHFESEDVHGGDCSFDSIGVRSRSVPFDIDVGSVTHNQLRAFIE